MDKKYILTLNLEDIIKAESEDDAITKYITDIESSNQTIASFIAENFIAKEACPHCEIPLESKMVDIDGTNLEEHLVCPDCGYGMPALR